MTAAEQKKAKILVVVLVVAGFVWYFVLWGQPAATAPPAVPKGPASAAATAKPQTLTGEGVIRTDLLPEPDGAAGAGNTNLFQYRPRPEPPRPSISTLPSGPATTIYVAPVVPRNPSPPQPPPFRQFRYESVVKGASTGKLTAFLTDGTAIGTTYEASEGEVVLGQYKITRLTETMVEIEDLFQNGRRQSFPKVQQ